ncbi:hypothetical protein Pmani_003346 [Petrolisthes manimaculis]|uniref:C2H2-type domain-containing protein n=1 Tax=Petrolisthes manimaculis TaxID=1843537 RepID=A0AAE1UMK0_9EUCA|nr:hypothetical protein Pmani_003346 [Petrolisthes manimaculis]
MGEWADVSSRWKSLKMQIVRKLHRCPFCAYSSVYQNNLTKHVRTHTGEKPFVCALCPFRTSQNSSLKRHMINIHGQVEDVPAQEGFPEFTLHP